MNSRNLLNLMIPARGPQTKNMQWTQHKWWVRIYVFLRSRMCIELTCVRSRRWIETVCVRGYYYLWVNASLASFLLWATPLCQICLGLIPYRRLPFWWRNKFKNCFQKCFQIFFQKISKPRKASNVHAGVPHRGLKGGAYATPLRAGPVQNYF